MRPYVFRWTIPTIHPAIAPTRLLPILTCGLPAADAAPHGREATTN